MWSIKHLYFPQVNHNEQKQSFTLSFLLNNFIQNILSEWLWSGFPQSDSTWIMRQQPHCARTPHHTLVISGEATVWSSQLYGWLGGHDGVRPIWPGRCGYIPTLFKKHPEIFNDHRQPKPQFSPCLYLVLNLFWVSDDNWSAISRCRVFDFRATYIT